MDSPYRPSICGILHMAYMPHMQRSACMSEVKILESKTTKHAKTALGTLTVRVRRGSISRSAMMQTASYCCQPKSARHLSSQSRTLGSTCSDFAGRSGLLGMESRGRPRHLVGTLLGCTSSYRSTFRHPRNEKLSHRLEWCSHKNIQPCKCRLRMRLGRSWTHVP